MKAVFGEFKGILKEAFGDGTFKQFKVNSPQQTQEKKQYTVTDSDENETDDTLSTDSSPSST